MLLSCECCVDHENILLCKQGVTDTAILYHDAGSDECFQIIVGEVSYSCVVLIMLIKSCSFLYS